MTTPAAQSHAPSSSTSAEPRRHVIVGTAGHIDHGKSALVEALTGTHPDRLEEEKRRGITIDL
ncbi:MAG TPA: GTP-binding protein, partial [Candidatus Acidoferrales bacterium]|nr:GTP-binding protein [Candidatus Acidoferrales bacterium]